MARTFLYQYQNAGMLGGPKPDNEHDCDDCVPIPSIGDMLTRRGQQWRVDSVLYVRTILPTRSSQPPMECLISLTPLTAFILTDAGDTGSVPDGGESDSTH